MRFHVGRCGHRVELCECTEDDADTRSAAVDSEPVAEPRFGYPDHDQPSQSVTGVGVSDSQLAVLLRQVQWACDEAAYHVAGAGLTRQRREELAGTLEALAEIIRASVPEGGR